MPELQESPVEFANQLKLMRIFTFDGIEMHDEESLGILKNGDFLFYSFSINIIYHKLLSECR